MAGDAAAAAAKVSELEGTMKHGIRLQPPAVVDARGSSDLKGSELAKTAAATTTATATATAAAPLQVVGDDTRRTNEQPPRRDATNT